MLLSNICWIYTQSSALRFSFLHFANKLLCTCKQTMRKPSKCVRACLCARACKQLGSLTFAWLNMCTCGILFMGRSDHRLFVSNILETESWCWPGSLPTCPRCIAAWISLSWSTGHQHSAIRHFAVTSTLHMLRVW